ncbi:MAG: hypothetical protein JST00_03555 [Deltaproteobacteria bacterium]|nr:hypothetical protein [Deltaproteobacteria bacterium]
MTRSRLRSSLAPVALLSAASALVCLGACTIVNGLVADPPDGGAVVITDGASGDGEAGPIANGCATPPPKPSVPDDGTLETVAVARRLFLTPPVGAAPVGFDLDDSCLLPTSDTCRSPQPFSDDKGGLDNRGAQLFALVNDRTDLEQRANDGILAGKNGLLVKIAKYNGKAEDYLVEISLYSAIGLLDGGDVVPPAFVESEKWTIDEGQFSELGLPKLLVDGWVTGGKAYALVPPNASLRLSNSFSVQLSGGVLRFDLDLSTAKPRITGGVIAGRWPARDILATLSRQRLTDAGASALCNPSQAVLLELGRQQVCGNVDIMSDRTKDRTGAACDATSVAFAFEAAPASLGPRMPFTPEDDCPGFDAGACEK